MIILLFRNKKKNSKMNHIREVRQLLTLGVEYTLALDVEVTCGVQTATVATATGVALACIDFLWPAWVGTDSPHWMNTTNYCICHFSKIRRLNPKSPTLDNRVQWYSLESLTFPACFVKEVVSSSKSETFFFSLSCSDSQFHFMV